jgi:hypothetical protein
MVFVAVGMELVLALTRRVGVEEPVPRSRRTRSIVPTESPMIFVGLISAIVMILSYPWT